MPRLLPSTFDDWEQALCRRFLMSETGDAVPVRSFEITPSTLASAIGPNDVADREEVTAAFRNVFELGSTFAALEHGNYARLTRVGLPGCFCYLALTLLVDALLDEEIVELGAFRAKLRSFLGVERSFSNLGGVARMWSDLQTWLDAAVAQGRPFRALELPPIPPTWTHIGYTLRLSFPSGPRPTFCRTVH